MSELSYKEILTKEFNKKENELDQEEINEKVEAAKLQGEKAITLLKEELGNSQKALRLAFKAPQINFVSIREIKKSIKKVEDDLALQLELNKTLFPNK